MAGCEERQAHCGLGAPYVVVVVEVALKVNGCVWSVAVGGSFTCG